MTPIIHSRSTDRDGGVSYALGEGKKGISINLWWTIHSEKQASLHLSWNAQEVASIEKAEAFCQALGEMVALAKEKIAELAPREFV